MTYKIQEYSSMYGWVNLTRAGPTEGEAQKQLAAYQRNYPSRKHRLVLVDSSENIEHYTVISD